MSGPADPERSLEGWSPRIPDELPLAAAMDLAFDYRGDVTLDLADGSEVVGYVFNRSGEAAVPVAELYVAGEQAPRVIRYADIRAVRFTGRDQAAGSTYAAWLRHREAKERTAATTPGES